jgi:flavin reductase (DIM6/NTAB) family NADH-FMN oxidoreductase RutF
MIIGRNPTEPEIDHGHFRETLGHFPSGVAVITAITDDGPVGFSCQSFSSLSLDPPLILIAPAKTSTTWPRIHSVGSFCVNILAAHQAVLARRFAMSGADKFADVTWATGTSGVPRLDGVAAWIDADIAGVSDGGDHFIVQGRVRALHGDPSVAPLVFHRGGFAELVQS